MLNTNQNKILITGASGYLGKNLCKHFYENGFYVIAQTRDITNEELKQISHKQVILEDIWNLELDYLVHNLSLTKYFGDWKQFEKINIELSKKILNHFREIPSVFISSISVFGYTQDKKLINEHSIRLDIEDKNIDMYSKSKIIVEDFITSSNLNTSIIRPSIIYGNRAKSNGRQIISKQTTVPLVEINTLCKAVEKSLQNKIVVNAVDDEAILRKEYEKENPNLIILPRFVFQLAKLIFKKPSRLHQLNMMSRENRYDNRAYKRLISEP